MGQLTNLLRSLSRKQQISIGIAAVIVIAALYTFTNWHREQDFKPLYTGVAPEEAASIVQKIKESGADYRLSETALPFRCPPQKLPNCASKWQPPDFLNPAASVSSCSTKPISERPILSST